MLRKIASLLRIGWTVSLAAATLARADCPPGQPLLTAATGFTCPLTGGQIRVYRLSLSTNQLADIRLEKKNINIVVRVSGPPSAAVSDPVPGPLADYDNDGKPGGSEHVRLVADSAGFYQVQVRARYAHDPPGAFAIELESVRPATHQDQLLFQAREQSTQAKIQSDAGHYPQALELSQRALALGEEALGPDGAYMGELSQRLGSVEFLTGDREKAASAFERAIRLDHGTINHGTIDRGTEDADSPQLASALLGMGYVYIAANDYSKAEEVLQQAVEISTRNQGPESSAVADCLAAVALLQQH
ncbi:MAG: tetratricopeptide repeat protein, partial [Acidobacteriaceae bacterium]